MSEYLNTTRDLDTERAEARNSAIIDALAILDLIPENDPLDALQARPGEIHDALNTAVDDALAKVEEVAFKGGKITPASLTKDAAQLPDTDALRKVATIHHKAAVQAITTRVHELTEGVAAKITNLYDQLAADVQEHTPAAIYDSYEAAGRAGYGDSYEALEALTARLDTLDQAVTWLQAQGVVPTFRAGRVSARDRRALGVTAALIPKAARGSEDMKAGLESVAWLSDWAWSYRKPTDEWLAGATEETGYPEDMHPHRILIDRLDRSPWVPDTDEAAIDVLNEYLPIRSSASEELEVQRRAEFEATYGKAYHRKKNGGGSTYEGDHRAFIAEALGDNPGTLVDVNNSDWRTTDMFANLRNDDNTVTLGA